MILEGYVLVYLNAACYWEMASFARNLSAFYAILCAQASIACQM
jgi:hypothetical protein